MKLRRNPKRGSNLLALGMMLLAAPPVAAQAPEAKTGTADREASGQPDVSGTRMGLSQGVDGLLIEVQKRQKQLIEAEREVARREAAVVELEAMIDERIAALEADRAAIEERIATWEQQDGDRIKKLAKVYSAMPPASAAVLLTELELDLAVSVLSGMKQKQSAKVLAAINPRRALVLSRRLARPLAPAATP